jgi:poly-gamma-glutamate synthesis protein (capsule biosynthesis protein)
MLESKLKLFFAGDIHINEDATDLLFDADLKDSIKSCDVKCCNLEGPYTGGDKIMRVKQVGPCLKQNTNIKYMLCNAGFNMVNLANNHIMDYGEGGLRCTLSEFSDFYKMGIFNEELQSDYVSINKNGLKIAFISAAENTYGCCANSNIGYNWLFDEKFINKLKEIVKCHDYVILNSHIGAEDLQIPLPEVRELYRYYIDIGVSCIIGHHPHVIQGFEDYKGARIYYSLGNFRMDGFETDLGNQGAVVVLNIGKEGIEYQQYITRNKQGFIEFDNNNNVWDTLNNELYNIDKVNAWCSEMYHSVHKPIFYRGNVAGIWDKTFRERIKMAVKIMLGKVPFSDAFLLHNIGVETNLWITRRALNNLSKEKQI